MAYVMHSLQSSWKTFVRVWNTNDIPVTMFLYSALDLVFRLACLAYPDYLARTGLIVTELEHRCLS